jgi:hypothetical protein
MCPAKSHAPIRTSSPIGFGQWTKQEPDAQHFLSDPDFTLISAPQKN